jgi:WD40 repeat protein
MRFWFPPMFWIAFCIFGLVRNGPETAIDQNLIQSEPFEHVKLLKVISGKNQISPTTSVVSEGSSDRIEVAAVSQSGDQIAFARGDNKIFIQKTQTGAAIAKFDGPIGLERIIFDPSGRFLIVTAASYSHMIIEDYIETSFLGIYDIKSKKWRFKYRNLPVGQLHFNPKGQNLIAVGNLKADRTKELVYHLDYFSGRYQKISSMFLDEMMEKFTVSFSRYFLNDQEKLLVYKSKTCSEKPDSINAYLLGYEMNQKIESTKLSNLKNCDYLDYMFASQNLLIEDREKVSAYNQKGNTIWSQEKSAYMTRVSPKGDIISFILDQASGGSNPVNTKLILISTTTGNLIGSIDDFPSDPRWHQISSNGKFISAFINSDATIRIWGTQDHQSVFRSP